MAFDGSIQEHNSDTTNQLLTMCTHSYGDLTHVSPVVFLYLLIACYFRGNCKATKKFRFLQETVYQALHNSPRPGPAMFAARCLLVLPIFQLHCEEFSLSIISGLVSFLKTGATKEDIVEAKSGEAILLQMIEHKEHTAAEKWASFMGMPMLCVLVQQYLHRSMVENAYNVMKKNSLKDVFSEPYHKGKESRIKKFAEKGLWDIAEERANNNKQLIGYLVCLAVEAGYFEKVEELCKRYALEGFANVEELQASLPKNRFVNLNELALDGIKWVDDVSGLHDATCHIEGCKVIGLDCEWRPVYEKGKKPKVSIIQIASEKMVHILDLIKLFEDAPEDLDNCLTRIFRSSKVLKLGFDFQSDAKHLARSYESLECFKNYEMLLDIQNLSNEPQGGLSGLTKKILGAGLNKTRRNSNWEQRPLTPYQLEYAALDAVVLIHIFAYYRGQSPEEWKAHIGLVKV